jgi:hypothetical protein
LSAGNVADFRREKRSTVCSLFLSKENETCLLAKMLVLFVILAWAVEELPAKRDAFGLRVLAGVDRAEGQFGITLPDDESYTPQLTFSTHSAAINRGESTAREYHTDPRHDCFLDACHTDVTSGFF